MGKGETETGESQAGPLVKKENLPYPYNKRDYNAQLMEYTNHTLTDPEKGIYDTFFNTIKERNNIIEPQELMMLDIAVHHFIRIKRLQILINKEGESYFVVMSKGVKARKVADHAYLLNAIETQFRNYMKEMSLSRKENIRRQVGKAAQDFTKFLSEAKTVELEEDTEGKKKIKASKD